MKIINWTLLFLVMFFCCLDSVKANPLQQDTIRDVTYQLYPLGVACRNNDMATIKRLLAGEDEPMAMGNDFYEFDIFYTAIYFDKEDVLKYALARYKDINNRLYSDEYGLTLLTYACKLSNVRLARILLEHGISVNGYQSPYDTYKVYPIMEAIANNNIELVKLLLEYHADLNIKDSNGNTPLALAKETGAKEVEDLLLQWMKQHTFGQSYKETIQEEIDAINEMPLWIAYLVPLDSLGKVIEDEYMEFNQIHSYKILDDGQIKNANILFTMYFDSDNKIRKVFKRWADGEALHSIAYYNSNGRLVYGIYNKGDETHGKLYADASGFHIEHFPEENECNDCFEAYLFLSTKSIEAQYNIILQISSNAKRTTFIPQIGDSAILCSSYIYSLPDGEKTTKGEDGIAVQFGMPVVISELTNGWCRINSIFNAPIGYISIQDIEIIK